MAKQQNAVHDFKELSPSTFFGHRVVVTDLSGLHEHSIPCFCRTCQESQVQKLYRSYFMGNLSKKCINAGDASIIAIKFIFKEEFLGSAQVIIGIFVAFN